MTILFETYIVADASGGAVLPFEARGFDGVGTYGGAILPFAAHGTCVGTGTASGGARLPFNAFGADVDTIGHARLSFDATGYESSMVSPSIAIGSTTLPFSTTGYSTGSSVANGGAVLPFDVFGTDADMFGHTRLPFGAYGKESSELRTASLYQFPWVEALGHDGVRYILRDQFMLLPGSYIASLTQQLLTVLGFVDSSPRMSELIKRINSTIGMRAVVGAALRIVLTDTLELTDKVTSSDLLLLALSDTLGLLGSPSWSMETDRLIATILVLHDAADDTLAVTGATSFELGNTLFVDVLNYARAISALRVAAIANGDLLLAALLHDTIGLSDALTSTAEILKALASAIGVTATLQLADGAYTAWVMNAESKAVWTYDNYPFNSFAQIGDRYYGAGPDGISELEGDDDAGVAIDWSARTGLTNFGTSLEKRGVMAYLGYTSAGDVGLSVIVTEPDGAKAQYNYHMIPRAAADTTANRIEIGKGLKSVYWQFEFAGNGPFTLSDASVLPMVLSRRI